MNEERIIYLNYWSKLRDNTEKEISYNQGRVATKPILYSEYTPKESVYNEGSKFWTYEWNYGTIRNRNTELYHSFQIPKHSGGYRTITAPCDELKELQKKVVKTIEKMGWLPSNNAHGFVKKRNCKTALEVHQKHKSRWFLKLDIHDFFGSTTSLMITEALKKNGVTCTLSDSCMDKLVNIVTLDGRVPQGAPTSPMICNIVMNEYDYKIQKYCHKNGLIYTRYADDILISSRVDWNWIETISAVQKILAPYTIAENKIRYGSFNGRNWNLGIMYTNQYKLTVGHERKHKLKCAVHNYCTKPECRSAETFYNLLGQLAYCKYIEPEYEWFTWAQIELNQFKPEPTLTTASETTEVEEEDILPFN